MNVLTVHPRYYSFYCFLLNEFWQRDLPRTRTAWITFFRPREFVFSLAANLCQAPEHGNMTNVVGSDTTAKLAREERSSYDVRTDYIKSPLGGYELYYRVVIAEMGLTYPGGPGYPYRVDVPCEAGQRLAAQFKSAVADTRYLRQYFDADDAAVPIEVIREYAERACLCQLPKETAPDRDMLRDIFLHHGFGPDARRATFRMLLDLANQTDGFAVDTHDYRQLIFYQRTSRGLAWVPSEAVRDTYRRWRLYQAREYYAFALNALWYFVCDWGLLQGGDLRPVSLDRLWEYLPKALDFDALARCCKTPESKLNSGSSVTKLLQWLDGVADVGDQGMDDTWRVDAPITEHRLYDLASSREHRRDPIVMVAGMIALLSLIYLRLEPATSIPQWDTSKMGHDGRLSVDDFIQSMRRRLKSGRFIIEDMAQWLLDDYVIMQHQIVATRKLPDNTYRFQRDGSGLRFYARDNALSMLDPRYNALSTTIAELGLCGNLQAEDHALSPAGQQLLDRGDIGATAS